jgi:hypothetical protein
MQWYFGAGEKGDGDGWVKMKNFELYLFSHVWVSVLASIPYFV